MTSLLAGANAGKPPAGEAKASTVEEARNKGVLGKISDTAASIVQVSNHHGRWMSSNSDDGLPGVEASLHIARPTCPSNARP